MIYKLYGKTGKQVSAVGFGGMRFDLKQGKEENARLLLYAYEKGITYFDTAPGYCKDQSEDIFGLALEQLRSERDKLYVTTKGMPTEFDTAAKARQAVEKSLKRLKVEKIDFYHVWCIRRMDQYELAMRPGGQYEELRRCQEEGLIDEIVISSHLRGEKISAILRKGEFAGVLLGVNILNFPYRWQAVEDAAGMGLGVVAMNPLAGGMIPQHEKEFGFLCEGGETATEAALRFCIGCPQITVTLNGFTTREHIDTACRVADKARPISGEQIARIRRQVSENMDTICTGCGYCLESCPSRIPIVAYMQFYNQKLLFGMGEDQLIKQIEEWQVWGMLADREGEAKDCVECGRCQEACTQHIPIIERLREAARWEEESQKRKRKKGE